MEQIIKEIAPCIQNALLQNELSMARLTEVAKRRTLGEFKFALDDCVQDVLVDRYHQNPELCMFLFHSDIERAKCLDVFASEIYNLLCKIA